MADKSNTQADQLKHAAQRALSILEAATSFTSKDARDSHDRAVRNLRAALAAQPTPEPVALQGRDDGAVPWTPGPNEFKDWCAQWFGPDSDDGHLSHAVFDLPPMAQVFARVSLPAGGVVEQLTLARTSMLERHRAIKANDERTGGVTIHDAELEAHRQRIFQLIDSLVTKA